MKKYGFSALIIGITLNMIQAQNLNSNQTNLMDSTLNSPLLVCKLSGPEFQKRKSDLQEEIFANVMQHEELPMGYLFHFEDKDDFLEKLMGYILAEVECCPFFQFDLKIRPDKEGIELKMTGTSGAKKIIEELVRSN